MQSNPLEADGLPSASSSLITSNSRPLRAALVGCANAPLHYVAGLAAHPDVKLAAIVDEDLSAARTWLKTLGAKIPIVANLGALPKSVPDVSVALIAVPLATRRQAIAEALTLGLNVFTESPISLTLADLDQLSASARDRSLRFTPYMPRRFDPGLVELPHGAGLPGADESRKARFSIRYPTLPVAEELTADTEAGGWQALLVYLALQTADLARAWLGDAVSVSADLDTDSGLGSRKGEFANIIVTHAGGQSVHQITRVRSTVTDERYQIGGSDGQIELRIGAGAISDGAEEALTRHRAGRQPEPIPFDCPFADGGRAAVYRFRAALSNFALELLGDEPAIVRPTDARGALEIVLAATISNAEGSKVSLPFRMSRSTSAIDAGPG